MKRKWWILGSAALAVVVSLCFFGVRLRIAPRLILSRALGDAITQLDIRFENSPAHLLAGVLDPEGRQHAQLKLETESAHLGPVVYDMALQTQLSPNRILAEGSVISGGRVLDLSLFLDENFAAISSQGLVGGRFFGITYDTFSRDIRDRQFLAMLIGEKTISDWEASVTSLQEKMSLDLTMPEISPEDVHTALYGVLALKPEIGREEILLPAVGDHKGYAVTFRATGQEINELSQPYRDRLTPEVLTWIDNMCKDPESQVSVKFSLYKGKLIQILAQLDAAGEIYECLLYLGEEPSQKTLSLELKAVNGGEEQQINLMIRTEPHEEIYKELLHFVKTEKGEQNSTTYEYQWDLSSGDMSLKIQKDGETIQQRLNLSGEGENLTIRSQNIRPVLNLLLEQERLTPAICTLTISPGREVAVPEYRNLNQWSAEDLLSLLGGLGGLLGLKLP